MIIKKGGERGKKSFLMPKKKAAENIVGKIAFVIGVVIAIIAGLFAAPTGTLLGVLVIIGIVIGLLNIAAAEATPFLLAGVSLVVVSYFSGGVFEAGGLTFLKNVLDSIMGLIVPATIIVALREIFGIARA